MQDDLPVGAPLDLLHDLVAVPLAGGERQRDLEDHRGEREEAIGAASPHYTLKAYSWLLKSDECRDEVAPSCPFRTEGLR